MPGVAAVFSSRLGPVLKRYVDLKRALGRRFDEPTRTLQLLDRFLQDHAAKYPDLNAAAFEAWCQTQGHLASGVRRGRMMEVCNFCLYRRRTEPRCFVPDPALFPKPHQRLQPYIFSQQEVMRLLRAASELKRGRSSPLRPEVIRLAIVLLFTTGIRRGELLRLILGDYNRQDATLLIRESKFHKSRLLPLNSDIVVEMAHYLRARAVRKLPISPDTALIWNATKGGLTAARACNSACSPYFKNAPSSPQKESCRGFMTLVIVSLSMHCCAGTGRAPKWGPSSLCWLLIWGMFPCCPPTITCNGSSGSEPLRAKDLPATTANWLCPYRVGKEEPDEEATSQSAGRRCARLLHRPPAACSRNQPAHHPWLPRQSCAPSAVSLCASQAACSRT